MDKRHHAEDHTCDLDVRPHSVGSSRRIHLRGKNVFLMRPNVRVERREQACAATLASVRLRTRCYTARYLPLSLSLTSASPSSWPTQTTTFDAPAPIATSFNVRSSTSDSPPSSISSG